ncbi:unnamed protein product, partial [Protopolystoma xenopodis]
VWPHGEASCETFKSNCEQILGEVDSSKEATSSDASRDLASKSQTDITGIAKTMTTVDTHTSSIKNPKVNPGKASGAGNTSRGLGMINRIRQMRLSVNQPNTQATADWTVLSAAKSSPSAVPLKLVTGGKCLHSGQTSVKDTGNRTGRELAMCTKEQVNNSDPAAFLASIPGTHCTFPDYHAHQ